MEPLEANVKQSFVTVMFTENVHLEASSVMLSRGGGQRTHKEEKTLPETPARTEGSTVRL